MISSALAIIYFFIVSIFLNLVIEKYVHISELIYRKNHILKLVIIIIAFIAFEGVLGMFDNQLVSNIYFRYTRYAVFAYLIKFKEV